MRDLHAVPKVAAAFLLAGCNVVTSSPEPVATVVMQRPDAVVVPGAVFDTIAVQVRDASGRPVPGVRVDWSGDGEVTPFATHTDDVGIARARWALPGRAVLDDWDGAPRTGPSGRFSIAAQVAGLDATTITVHAKAFMADRVSASEYYGCALRDHQLWCWGNTAALDPVGVQWAPPRRVSLPSGLQPVDLRTALNTICVLDDDGLPYCAVPGYGDRFDRILAAPPMRELVHTLSEMCGLAKVEGSVWCWPTPWNAKHDVLAVQVQPGPFIDLAGGSTSWCGLAADGVAWCWGANDRGQLGDGTTTPRDDPAPVSGVHRFSSLAAGGKRACGSTDAGEVWCWGWAGGSTGNYTVVPERIVAPDVVGPVIDVGQHGELYLLRNNRLLVHGEVGAFFTEAFAEQRIRQFSVDVLACLVNLAGEVHCSWEMLAGLIHHRWGPGAPAPVPPSGE